MTLASGGFDPDRLTQPKRAESIVSRIVGHSAAFENDPDSDRPDDVTLVRTFRDLVARFDQFNDENLGLKEANSSLEAELKETQERMAKAEETLKLLSESSRSALEAATEMLERAERAVESRRGGTQAEINGRFETAKKRALELQMTAALMLEEAREVSARRALEADLEAIGILREGRQSLQAAAEELRKRVQETVEPEGPSTSRETPEPRPKATVLEIESGEATEGRAEPTIEAAPEEAMVLGAETTRREPMPAEGQPAAPAVPGEAQAPGQEAVEPPPGLGSEVAQSRQGTVSASPEVVELIVSSPTMTGSLGSMLQALGRSQGVVQIHPGEIEGGKLRITLRYAAPVSPLTPLLALSEVSLRLVTFEANRVEIELMEDVAR